MSEQKPAPDRSSPAPRRSKREVLPGKHASADGLQLRSYDVGALPLLNRIVERMQLQRILSEHLPRDDSRTELPTVTALLVLFANLLLAREPIYGVGEWAALFPPDLLGLREQDLSRMHDDRLGRSLQHLVAFLGEVRAAGVDLYLHQQALDTSTPAGKAMFQMCGVFAEFERAMIVERVNAGLKRAKAAGKVLGRPRIDARTEADIRTALAKGDKGILKIAAEFGVGSGTVQRIKAETACA